MPKKTSRSTKAKSKCASKPEGKIPAIGYEMSASIKRAIAGKIASVAKKEKLTLETIKHVSKKDNSVTITLTLRVSRKDCGKVVPVEVFQFRRMAHAYGLNPAWLHRNFYVGDNQCRIEGLIDSDRVKKNVIVSVNGKTKHMSPSDVRQYIAPMSGEVAKVVSNRGKK